MYLRDWSVRTLLLLVLVAVLTGCPASVPVKTIKNRDKALASLLAQLAGVTSLEGSAKLRIYETGKRRRTVRLLFQLQRPNKLNFQLLGVASQPALIIASNGKRFSIHNLLNGEFRRGPASRLTRQLGSLLPPSLKMEQLVPLLLGQIPMVPAAKRTWSQSGPYHRLSLVGATLQQQLLLDFQKPRFVSGTLVNKGQPSISLRFGGETAKGRLPRAIRVKAKGNKMRFSWIYLDVTVNPRWKKDPFVHNPPKGVTVLDM